MLVEFLEAEDDPKKCIRLGPFARLQMIEENLFDHTTGGKLDLIGRYVHSKGAWLVGGTFYYTMFITAS